MDGSATPAPTALSTETPAQTATRTPVVYIGLPEYMGLPEGWWYGMDAAAISEILPRRVTVVVGHVTGILEPYYERQGTSLIMDDCSVITTDTPKGRKLAEICRTLAPQETREPTARDFTVYSVEVVDSVYGFATVGQEVAVAQSGGVLEGVPHVDLDDPQLMEVGETYLFFLCCGSTDDPMQTDDPARSYDAPPFGRFRVAEDGTLMAQTNDCPEHPLIRQLSGLKLEDAIALIDAELALPFPTLVPTESPQPSGPTATPPVTTGSPDPTVQWATGCWRDWGARE